MVLLQVWQNSATIKLGLDWFQSEGFCCCFHLLMSCGMLKLGSSQFNLIAWMSQEIHPFLLYSQLTGVQVCKIFPCNVLNYQVSVLWFLIHFCVDSCGIPLYVSWAKDLQIAFIISKNQLLASLILFIFYCFYFIKFFFDYFLPSTGIELIKSVFPNYLIASLTYLFVLDLIF